MDDNSSQFELNVYNQSLDIFFAEDGFRMLGSGRVLGTTQYPDRVKLMDGYERFASSRGYIWSRSLPLLKDTLLIGYGPDMFAIKFPQHDYIGKINAYDNPSIIVDKPHNLYLQIGINTGVVSLLALLAVFGMYIFDSLKLYLKRDISTYLEHIGVGAVTGVIAYLGAAFFNDQIISVAPLFYVMVGLGIAVNHMVKNQEQA
jgi:O-antigen ligase